MNPHMREIVAASGDVDGDVSLPNDNVGPACDIGEGGILARSERFSQLVPPRLSEAFHLVIDEMVSPVAAVIDGRNTILFGTNSYLGLNFHPTSRSAAIEAIDEFGTGTTASRVAGGTSRHHVELERELANFYGRRHAIVYSTGFMANLGVISGLLRPGDAVFLDAHSHASIIDAAKLSGATSHFFRHNDPADLGDLFRRIPVPGSRVLVAVEGLYSVSGDIAVLAELLTVAKRHGAVTMVDEAHSLGVYGAQGRGVAEHLGCEALADIIVGTFSKSAGVIGGFSVTDRPELRDLRLRARSYLYTAALPASVVTAATQSLRLMRSEPVCQERLWANTKRLREGMAQAGITLSGTGPIGRVSVATHSVVDIWHALLDRGIYVGLLFPPATPDGKGALRFSVSAAHTPDDIDKAVAAVCGAMSGRIDR